MIGQEPQCGRHDDTGAVIAAHRVEGESLSNSQVVVSW
jgi:hypothetical protein